MKLWHLLAVVLLIAVFVFFIGCTSKFLKEGNVVQYNGERSVTIKEGQTLIIPHEYVEEEGIEEAESINEFWHRIWLMEYNLDR